MQPALLTAVKKVKALPKPKCKVGKVYKSAKTWWSKVVTPCYTSPQKISAGGG